MLRETSLNDVAKLGWGSHEGMTRIFLTRHDRAIFGSENVSELHPHLRTMISIILYSGQESFPLTYSFPPKNSLDLFNRIFEKVTFFGLNHSVLFVQVQGTTPFIEECYPIIMESDPLIRFFFEEYRCLPMRQEPEHVAAYRVEQSETLELSDAESIESSSGFISYLHHECRSRKGSFGLPVKALTKKEIEDASELLVQLTSVFRYVYFIGVYREHWVCTHLIVSLPISK